MPSAIRNSLLAIATVATLVTAASVAPASAHGWGMRWGGGGGGWDRGWDRGWDDRGYGRPHWRRHGCWIEERPMRVMTPWGPRMRLVEQRVCR